MDKIATLAWLDFMRLVRDRTQLGVMLVLPLMLTFLFGTMMGGVERKVSVAVADLDGTAISREVVAGLPERSYSLRKVDEEIARQMASSGEVAAAVIVPKGFGDDVLAGVDTKVSLVKDPRSTSALAIAQAVQGRVRRIAANAQTIRIVRAAYRDAERSTGVPAAGAASVDIYAYADRLWSPSPPLSVREEAVQASEVRGQGTGANGFQQYSMGFTLMFMLFMGMGTAGGFLEDREEGTLARLLMTPTSKPLLIAGKVVGVYATVLFEAAIMVGFGAFVFGVPWGDDPLGVVLLIASFGLAATGLGVMVSTLVRTRGQMSAVMAAGATALCMLGGAYWPLDIVNPAMRLVANFTPVGWAMQGLTDIVVRGQGAAQALLPTLVLIGMAALFLAVGISRLKLE
ncbi:MAG: ABC transporter permease [Coriobacteriia bacterium]|nr:ABC transporter permease [Coriobacteriia bacterium]